MRKGHWLRGNSATRIPFQHVCVATTVSDGEDGEELGRLKQAAIRTAQWQDGKWVDGWAHETDTQEKFWEAMQGACASPSTAWVWFLNPDQDLIALDFTRLVERGDFVRNFWVWGAPPVIVSGRLWGQRVKIIGVSNWLNTDLPTVPVGKLAPSEFPGDSLGVSLLSQGPTTILARGCAAFVESILSFVHREDLGHLRATVGSQAMQAYRHLHLPGKIGIHNNPSALRLEREASLGIPVRLPRVGPVQGPVYVLDVNSLYPYVQATYPYPRKLLWHCDYDDPAELRLAAETHLLIARVTGYDHEGDYLVKRGDRYVWDNELKNDVLAGPDLDRALWRGCIEKVNGACAYEGAGIFAQWGTWAWQLRQRYRERGDKIGGAIAKSLSVALWGQFAARLERWVPFDYDPPDDKNYQIFYVTREHGEQVKCRVIAAQVDRMECKQEPDNSFPAIAAFVAAYARMYVSGLIAIAGWPNLLYQCADCIHVNAVGFANLQRSCLVDESAFGKLKLKGTFDDVFYHAPNCLRLGDEWTWAGRHVDAVETAPGLWEWESAERLHAAVMHAPTGRVRYYAHKVQVSGG